jgi:hypothetical protein
MKFSMTLKLDIHEHSPTAHRAEIATALDQVKSAVASGVLTEGDILKPPHVVIGRWEMTEA